MAWSWSHSEEAYAALEQQIARKGEQAQDGDREAQEWLIVVCSENDVMNVNERYEVWFKRYKEAKRRNYRIAQDRGWVALSDKVWTFAQMHSTCDNGGWNAYCCPDGCHTLPFTDPRENEE